MTKNAVGQVMYTRGEHPESQHDVHVVVVDAQGRRLAHCGDAELLTFPRSSSKPVQALPLALAAPELPLDELAIACASHAGTPRHLAVVERLLARSGSSAANLRCGTHPPFDPDAAADLIRRGERAHPAAPQLLRQTRWDAAGLHLARLAARRLHRAGPSPAAPHPGAARRVGGPGAGRREGRHRRLQRAGLRAAAERRGSHLRPAGGPQRRRGRRAGARLRSDAGASLFDRRANGWTPP